MGQRHVHMNAAAQQQTHPMHQHQQSIEQAQEEPVTRWGWVPDRVPPVHF
jgi:hypothetical protein